MVSSTNEDIAVQLLKLEMENHQLKKTLREREFEQFTLSKIQSLAKVGTWTLNHLSYDVQLSEELTYMLGLKPERSLLPWQEFLAILDPTGQQQLKRRLMSMTADTEDCAYLQHHYIDKDNHRIHFKHYRKTFYNSINQPLRSVGLIQDTSEEINQAQELELRAITDDLTCLHNRRKLNESLHKAVHKAQTLSMPFCITLFDLDHFKNINDSFGHQYGDQVLISTAHTLKSLAPRNSDFGRWGGEEFLMIGHNQSLADACNVAQHIQFALNQFALPNKQLLSASFGVTQYDFSDTLTSLLTRVDKLMYQAKDGGRNKLCCG